MPDSLPKPQSAEHPTLVERDRFATGELHVTAFADPADPAGELAALQIGVGLHTATLSRERAQELALTLLAFSNGNWMGLSDAELEVRHGQLKLELERAHG